MKDKYYVYCHTNKTNGKKYVGITSKQKPEYRWAKGEGYKTQFVFYRAIQKYGWDGFEHEILFENLSENEAKNKEIELIQQFNSKIPNGYNVTDGGDVNWKKSLQIYCYETEECFDDEFEAYDKHKEIFKNRYDASLIKDCCEFNIPYLPVPWSKIRYHYQYTNMCNIVTTEEVEKMALQRARYKFQTKKPHTHFKKHNGKYYVEWTDNVCSNCGNLYRTHYEHINGVCEKCKCHKIKILKNKELMC